jgi:glycosyltransferase involved in cell wall biosynthesis
MARDGTAIVYSGTQTVMSLPRPVLDVVIPVYNEGENILSLLNAFEEQIQSKIRVLICYDREDDTTLPSARLFNGKFDIVFVKNKDSHAHGAVMTGFEFSDAPAVISYMADDDYNAPVIDKMVELFHQGYDVVCASRFMPGGSMIGCPWPKSFLVRAVSYTLYVFGRIPSRDSTNAFRLFSKKLLSNVRIESKTGFTYSLELLAKAHRFGYKISEVPAQWFERVNGSSRFQVFRWAPYYLRWYFYVFATRFVLLFKRNPA